MGTKIYRDLTDAETENLLSNGDACMRTNEEFTSEKPCCQGLVANDETGMCQKQCTARNENPWSHGFFTPCCEDDGDLQAVSELDENSRFSRESNWKCVAVQERCAGLDEAYNQHKPCCEGLTEGSTKDGHSVCVPALDRRY